MAGWLGFRASAYRADVVVGTFDAFAADLGHETELGVTRHSAAVEPRSSFQRRPKFFTIDHVPAPAVT